ncbi:MAG: sigma-54 dependent transcriptional regulator [Bacteroidota bacterium]
MTIEQIKQRFEIIGASPLFEHALDIAMQVAPTDLTILISGESGTGKEVFPKIIHLLSSRKHGKYFAVNCGAIPEGTIDSELFGHEKGSFTGAHEARKGYFEEADGGTIFLDEIAELPIQTQVRLLRVLESGEFITVGSSKVQKTNVRIVAATNINITEAIQKGKFREDLYYRLNTVPIRIPNLRERKEDINLFFRKFASDFAEKYRMPSIKLDPEAQDVLIKYHWPGNVRQLKNITEQISVIEKNRNISVETLLKYLPEYTVSHLPVLFKNKIHHDDLSDRELLYKVLFDMKKDMTDLKNLFLTILQSQDKNLVFQKDDISRLKKVYNETEPVEGALRLPDPEQVQNIPSYTEANLHEGIPADLPKIEETVEESLSLQEKEKELIIKALQKHKSNKTAAEELGISERTLYRKIKEYNIK